MQNYVFLFEILRKGCFATAILVRSFLLKNSSLGVLLIVVYGKSDTTTKILQVYDLNFVSLAMFFIAYLKVFFSLHIGRRMIWYTLNVTYVLGSCFKKFHILGTLIWIRCLKRFLQVTSMEKKGISKH